MPSAKALVRLADSTASRAKSEQELQRELDLARECSGPGNHPGGAAIVIAREDHRIRGVKVSVIEKIEGLRPKLQTPFLIDAELLEQRGVHVG